MDPVVTYRLDPGIARITMDDGKVNALSPRMLHELGSAFDRAEADRVPVVLSGRPGMFSAGFDLAVLRTATTEALDMLRAGFELSARLLAFPRPVVIACTGHAIAMASFLLLSGDYRIGADGPFKITANEVAIGLTMPHAAVEICRQRLAPAHFHRAVILADVYEPRSARDAGFLDEVVPPDALGDSVTDAANRVATLDMSAHAETKLRARAHALQAIRAGIAADDRGFRLTA
jgi:enoyl-CoA hydratase